MIPKVIPGSTTPVATAADVADDLSLAQIRIRQARRIARCKVERWAKETVDKLDGGTCHAERCDSR